MLDVALSTVTYADIESQVWSVERQTWSLPNGTFTVFVGTSSRNLPLATTLSIVETSL